MTQQKPSQQLNGKTKERKMVNDGLSSTEQHATTASGTTLQYASIEVNEGEIDSTEVTTDIPTAKTGSPSAGGNTIQFGTVAAFGEAAWTVFGTPFAAAPKILLTPATSGASALGYVGTVELGSFSSVVEPSGTAQSWNWFAIGSGRV